MNEKKIYPSVEDLYQIMLQLDANWMIEKIGVSDEEERVDIEVKYISKKAVDPMSGEQLSIYDHCPARQWRHLDTLQYKTFIVASIPRVKNSKGNVNMIEVPWADKSQRHTILMEKKL